MEEKQIFEKWWVIFFFSNFALKNQSLEDAEENPFRINIKKMTSRYIIVSFLKIKEREKNLRVNSMEKKDFSYIIMRSTWYPYREKMNLYT